jgi:PQQ-dependent catabolism-associated CXXCW motif protein
MRLACRTAALLAIALLTGAAGPAMVPEPEGIYTGALHGPTPLTLKGAKVLEFASLEKLLADEKPVLIDVAMADRKPEEMPAGKLWLPVHRSIPGAIWMPNAGAASLAPSQEEGFLRRVSELAGGDKARPIVTFCHPDCWASWNAAKRLVLAGYTRVHWFPRGIEGWQDEHETAVIKQDNAWTDLASAGSRKPRGDAER